MVAELTREYFEEEDMLNSQPLSAVVRHARARVDLDVEESFAVESCRPTVPVFVCEPWR
jgi:hypothetical protein